MQNIKPCVFFTWRQNIEIYISICLSSFCTNNLCWGRFTYNVFYFYKIQEKFSFTIVRLVHFIMFTLAYPRDLKKTPFRGLLCEFYLYRFIGLTRMVISEKEHIANQNCQYFYYKLQITFIHIKCLSSTRCIESK